VTALIATAFLTDSQFFTAWGVAALASTGVFLHANKVGIRHATAWGIGVFLLLGLALPVYLVHARTRKRDNGRRY